jgi:hypothetical protein
MAGALLPLQDPHHRTFGQSIFLNYDGSLKVEAVNVSSSGTDFADLCVVLADQLRKPDRVYLIIDGYDRIQESNVELLQQHLPSLTAQGMSVLLLSAVSELGEFPPACPVVCDNCGRGSDERDGLLIYWTCDLCPYDLCDACKIKGEQCRDDHHLMSEPYDVVRMRFDLVPSELKSFVRADLEAEYGSRLMTVSLKLSASPVTATSIWPSCGSITFAIFKRHKTSCHLPTDFRERSSHSSMQRLIVSTS